MLSRPIKAEPKGCVLHDPNGYRNALRTVENPATLRYKKDYDRWQELKNLDQRMQQGARAP